MPDDDQAARTAPISDLDDLVARTRALPTTSRSLYVETDGWTDWRLSRLASARRQRLLAPPPPPDPAAPRTRHHVRTWMAFDRDDWDHPLIGVTPRRCRQELEYSDVDGTVDEVVSGFDETTMWSLRHGEAQRSNRGRAKGSLQSGWVVGRHWIGDDVERELVDTDVDVEVLGRRCVRVRVVPPPGTFAPSPLHSGDEHLLDVDVATGMTLAVTSLHDGETLSHHEVLALELDPEVDVARTAPPVGAGPVAPPPPTSYRDVDAVAAAATELVLLAPTWLPDGYVFGTAGTDRRDGVRHAVLYYRRKGSPTLMISEDATTPSEREGDAADGWTSVERDGRRVVVSDVSDAVGVRLAWTHHHGTRALVHAELSAHDLLAVAFGLEPVAP